MKLQSLPQEHLRILVSAYACEPGRGSEPGVGWTWVEILSEFAEVTVITRANNREAIESAGEAWTQRVHWVYHELPPMLVRLKRGPKGVHLYYALWQWAALPVARRLILERDYDFVHQLTFGTYWMPTWCAWVDVPLITGPAGGAEGLRLAFSSDLLQSWLFEISRLVARSLGEMEPSARRAARRSSVCLAKAPETAARLRRMGARRVLEWPEVVVSEADQEAFASQSDNPSSVLSLVSLGRLVHWKGYHLVLHALAAVRHSLPEFTYTLIGAGADRGYLERLVTALDLEGIVTFTGPLVRQEALKVLRGADVFLHPSMHDSGGWACVEAMGCGVPVICLNTGGPATQVGDDAGIRVESESPQQVIKSIGEAIVKLGSDPTVRSEMGEAGRATVRRRFTRAAQASSIRRLYRGLAR